MKYTTDEEIDKTIKSIQNNDENCGELTVLTTIKLLKEIRDLLQTPSGPWNKVHKTPTGNKDDVIGGIKNNPDVPMP